MLIKTVNGRVVYDEIQSSEKIMCDQIRSWEGDEAIMQEKKKIVWESVVETRKEISSIKQRRAAKEAVLERFNDKVKSVELRLKEVQARNASNLNDTRVDQMVKKKEKKIKEEINKKMHNQAQFHHKILEGMIDADLLTRQMHVAYDRGMRIHERVRAQKDELMFLLGRQDEIKPIIRKKLAIIKEEHAKIFVVEPKIKESWDRIEKAQAKILELKAKVKTVEDETKRVEKERIKMVKTIEMHSVECNQKQKKQLQKAPPMIEALKTFAPPKKIIECYKVKNADVIKAFEKFTELYGGYNKPMAMC